MMNAPALSCAHPADRLEQLGLALGQVDRALSRLDTPDRPHAADAKAELIEGLADALERLIPFQPVTSPGGALAQLSALQVAVDDIFDVASFEQAPLAALKANSGSLRASASIRALALWLERTYGIDRAAYGGNRYLPADLDPAPAVGELLRAA